MDHGREGTSDGYDLDSGREDVNTFGGRDHSATGHPDAARARQEEISRVRTPPNGVDLRAEDSRDDRERDRRQSPAPNGSSPGSGLPSERSRRCEGAGARGRIGRGGRGLTRVPRLPWACTSPRTRSVRYAAATVVGLTRSTRARSRTVGSGAPAASRPWRIAASTLVTIPLAPSPRIPYCATMFIHSYCNKRARRNQ